MANFRRSTKWLLGGSVGLLLVTGALVASFSLSHAAPSNSTLPPTKITTTTVRTVSITISSPVYEFYAAHTGVQCEIVTNLIQQGPVPMNQITCYTSIPARRVILDDIGQVATCEGSACLADPGLGTPTLAVGAKVVSGNHYCEVIQQGIRCGNQTSVAFTMTKQRITSVGKDPLLIRVSKSQFEYEFFTPQPSNVLGCALQGTNVMCMMNNPAKRVTLHSNGTYSICNGDDCLGNAAIGTPTLFENSIVDNGLFACSVSSSHVTCRARNRGGFTISKNGITPAS